MIFVVFWSTAGWPAKSRDGRYGKPKTHIFPMDFDDFSKIGVPKTSKLLENHWFCKVFQPPEGSERSSESGGINWTGGTRGAPGGYSYSYILLPVVVLTRHSLRGGRIEDACGDVTGHPFVKLQALILDGLFRWMVVSFWAVSVPSWGQIWHSVGVIWAPVGPMKALTWHGWLVVTFWAAGCPKKALKTHCAPKPFLHIFPMVF